MIDRNREPTREELRYFGDKFIQVLRESMSPPPKDSAWLYAANRQGIQSWERPSRAMFAFVQYHEERLAQLLWRSTLFVWWWEDDTEATVQIMPVFEHGRELIEFEQRVLARPFERIKLPFPPKVS